MGSCQGLIHPPGPCLQQWTTASCWGVVQEESRDISSGTTFQVVLATVHEVILYSSVLDSKCLVQRKPKGGQWSQDEQEDREGAWSSSRRKEMVSREGQPSSCDCSLLYIGLALCRTLSEGTQARICCCWRCPH